MNRGMMALQKLRGGQQGPGLGPVSEPPAEQPTEEPSMFPGLKNLGQQFTQPFKDAYATRKANRDRIVAERAFRDSQPTPEISLPQNMSALESGYRSRMDASMSDPERQGVIEKLWAMLTGRRPTPDASGGDLAEGEPDDRSSAAMFGME